MSNEDVLVYIPSSLDCCECQQLACLRFNYQIEDLPQLPTAGKLFTGLTLEQAKVMAAFLDEYIHNTELSRLPVFLN
ncbi:hypothetical protein [Rouxiella sp. WC2420]|uniref:Transcriptional regulator n=1 Tax=Rouxiella sp. WC2420 TaxID=3234145 RepID=A0AB39VLG6_9GAMM